MGEEFDFGLDITVYHEGVKIGTTKGFTVCVAGGPVLRPTPLEIAELMSDPDKVDVMNIPCSGSLTFDRCGLDFATMFDPPTYDPEIPPRNGHYRTKRLQKKWARIHGEPSFGRMCDYYRDLKKYWKLRGA